MGARPLMKLFKRYGKRYWMLWALLLIMIGVPVNYLCEAEAKSKGVLWALLICLPPVLNLLLGIVMEMRKKTSLPNLGGITGGVEIIPPLISDDCYVSPEEYSAQGSLNGRITFVSAVSGLRRKDTGVWFVYSTLSCGKQTLLLHSVPDRLFPLYMFRNPTQNDILTKITQLPVGRMNDLTVILRFDELMNISSARQWYEKAVQIVKTLRQEEMAVRIVLLATVCERLDFKDAYQIRPLDRLESLKFLSALSNKRGGDLYKMACDHYGNQLGQALENYALGNPNRIAKFADTFSGSQLDKMAETRKHLHRHMLPYVTGLDEVPLCLAVLHLLLVLHETRAERSIDVSKFLTRIWKRTGVEQLPISGFLSSLYDNDSGLRVFDLRAFPKGFKLAMADRFVVSCGRAVPGDDFVVLWEQTVHEIFRDQEFAGIERDYVLSMVRVALRFYLEEALPEELNLASVYALIDRMKILAGTGGGEEVWREAMSVVKNSVQSYLFGHVRTLEREQALAICRDALMACSGSDYCWTRRFLELMPFLEGICGDPGRWGVGISNEFATRFRGAMCDPSVNDEVRRCDVAYVAAWCMVVRLSEWRSDRLFDSPESERLQNEMDRLWREASLGCLSVPFAAFADQKKTIVELAKEESLCFKRLWDAQNAKDTRAQVAASEDYDMFLARMRQVVSDVVDRLNTTDFFGTAPEAVLATEHLRMMRQCLQSTQQFSEVLCAALEERRMTVPSLLSRGVAFNMRGFLYQIIVTDVRKTVSKDWPDDDIDPRELENSYTRIKRGVDKACGGLGFDAEESARFFCDTVEWMLQVEDHLQAVVKDRYQTSLKAVWEEISQDVCANWQCFTRIERLRLLSDCGNRMPYVHQDLVALLEETFDKALTAVSDAALDAQLEIETVAACFASWAYFCKIRPDMYYERFRDSLVDSSLPERFSDKWRAMWLHLTGLESEALDVVRSLRKAMRVAIGQKRLVALVNGRDAEHVDDRDLLKGMRVLVREEPQGPVFQAFERFVSRMAMNINVVLTNLKDPAAVAAYIQAWRVVLFDFLFSIAQARLEQHTEQPSQLCLVLVMAWKQIEPLFSEYLTNDERKETEEIYKDMERCVEETEAGIVPFADLPKTDDPDEWCDGWLEKMNKQPAWLALRAIASVLEVMVRECSVVTDDEMVWGSLLAVRKKIFDFSCCRYEMCAKAIRRGIDSDMDVIVTNCVLFDKNYLDEYPEDFAWINAYVKSAIDERAEDATVARLAVHFGQIVP